MKCVLALMALLLAGCPSSRTPDTTAKSTTERTEFRLIASGDTQGWIMPCGCTANQSGGLLRRESYVQRQRDEAEVVLVDVGGAADGVAPYQLEKFKAVLAGEREMGLVAHNLGTAEVAFGAETLRALDENEQGHLFLSTNVVDETGTPLVDPYRLIEAAGQRLLVMGVVARDSTGAGLHVKEPVEAILSTLPTVPESYDWLVVLAYLPEPELRKLAETLPEASAIVGGPTGQSLRPERVGRVLLTSATNKGKFLAELQFGPERQSTIEARVVEMTPDFPDAPTQQTNLERFRRVLAERDFTAAESGLLDATRWAVGPDQRVAGTDACLDCHAGACDIWDGTGHAEAWHRLEEVEASVDSYCQQCHTTGFGWPEGFVSARRSPRRVDVGCESCHGPSHAHAERPAVRTPFDAQGACIKCHDPENSPTFAYAEFWERIEHGTDQP